MDMIFDDPQSVQSGQDCPDETVELVEITKVEPVVQASSIAQAMEDHSYESMPTF